jgi:hypothetical protein
VDEVFEGETGEVECTGEINGEDVFPEVERVRFIVCIYNLTYVC